MRYIILGIVVTIIVYLYVSKVFALMVAVGVLSMMSQQRAIMSINDNSNLNVLILQAKTYFLRETLTMDEVRSIRDGVSKDVKYHQLSKIYEQCVTQPDCSAYAKTTLLQVIDDEIDMKRYFGVMRYMIDEEYDLKDFEYFATRVTVNSNQAQAYGLFDDGDDAHAGVLAMYPELSGMEAATLIVETSKLLSVNSKSLIKSLVKRSLPFFELLRPWQVRDNREKIQNGDLRKISIFSESSDIIFVLDTLSDLHNWNAQPEFEKRLLMELVRCPGVTISQQMRYPLCWMMATVTLLDNLNAKHGTKINLHKHVVDFIKTWKKELTVTDPTMPACPLITPKALRDHTMKLLQDKLQQVMVTVYKHENLVDRICLENNSKAQLHPLLATDSIEDFAIMLKENNVLKDRKTNPPSTKDPLPIFETRDAFSFYADFTDPVVKDYMEGKMWLYQHPVCVSRFIGGDSIRLTESLLSYNNDVTIIENLSRKPNKKGQLCFYVSPVLDSPVSLNMDTWNKQTFIENGFVVLGGNISSVSTTSAHALSYVICDAGIVYMDTNYPVPFETLTSLLAPYGEPFQFKYTMIIRTV